jgi:hypothetical protein
MVGSWLFIGSTLGAILRSNLESLRHRTIDRRQFFFPRLGLAPAVEGEADGGEETARHRLSS